MNHAAPVALGEPAYDFGRVTAALGLPAQEGPTFDPVELTPTVATLRAATIGLLVTSGAYYPDQPRLGETNDLSYRLLPKDRNLDEILFAHMTPIRAFALADANVAYPRDRMVELEEGGVIGRLADQAVSMVGSISKLEELATETAPRLVAEFLAMDVDLVLVLPFCPGCHRAGGVLARAIERRGLATASIATLRKTALQVKAPRSCFLDFPLGCPAGRPNDAAGQRAILTAALSLGVDAALPWTLPRLPFEWSPDGSRDWEALVDDLYRMDNQIRGTLASRGQAHTASPSIVGREREFSIRCFC
jgi:D-proline reductase (dithiol) PrdB